MCQRERVYVYVLEWCMHESAWMMNAAAVIVMFFGPSWGYGWAHQDYDCVRAFVVARARERERGRQLHFAVAISV